MRTLALGKGGVRQIVICPERVAILSTTGKLGRYKRKKRERKLENDRQGKGKFLDRLSTLGGGKSGNEIERVDILVLKKREMMSGPVLAVSKK